MLRIAMMGGAFCCLMALAAAPAHAWPDDKKPAAEEKPLYWIFLTTGKSTKGTEPSEVQKMQAAHLANFGALHKEDKLFAAGPMKDPEGKKRGIVVATAADPMALAELFEPDPLVKQGFLKVDAIKMKVGAGGFHKDYDKTKMAEYRLVLLENAAADGAEIDDSGRSTNQAYCKSLHDAGRLCFAAWLSEEKARRGILIFRKLEDNDLNALVNDLPAVKSKSWKATTYPLYMSDGVVK